LTAPPGFPNAGHGPPAAIARGYSSRLYARAFYFRDTHGTPLVLVSCDLFAMSGGLWHSVLEKVNAAGISLPSESLIDKADPIALLVFASVHPTALRHDVPLVSADVSGRAMESLEQTWPVAGFFNGSEGDVSPDWSAQRRRLNGCQRKSENICPPWCKHDWSFFGA
jgi:hypothetical protein